MFGYIAFPVILFHWFNQPENFEKYTKDYRDYTREKEPLDARETMKNFITDFNRQADLDEINEMEAKYKSKINKQ